MHWILGTPFQIKELICYPILLIGALWWDIEHLILLKRIEKNKKEYDENEVEEFCKIEYYYSAAFQVGLLFLLG